MAIGNRLNRRVGARFDRFDPNAIDGDNDGLVQEQTSFERPATIRNRAVTGSVSASNRPQSLQEALDAVKGADEAHQVWARIANENGWRVLKRESGHIVYLSPDKNVSPITVGYKDFGVRGVANAESLLRRSGLPIPKKDAKQKASTSFGLEDSSLKLSKEKLKEAIEYAAATKNDAQKISIDELAELLGIEEDLKPELEKSVNQKFPGYFPEKDKTPEPEARKLTRRERRRGIVEGSISSSQDGKKPIAPESLFKEAEAAGVSLDAILDDSDFDNDVEWSSNSWSIGKTKVQQAGDAVIVRNNKDGKPEVLMIRRKTAPFTDGYALPGGLLDEGETFEQTVDREMEEEVGVPASKADSRRYLGDIKAKDWDPRFVEGVHVGATRFDVPENTDVVAGSDAKGAEWVSVEDLANGKHRIGFGHAAWLSLAFENDTELSRKFDILARASRHRNQEIIRRVNEKRKEAGAKLFTGLESPNKHYIPEGTGPLGVRKVNNLRFDLAKVITRNPGFFDKRTEEIFKYRASNSSAETAKKFGITERELDETLLESTQKLEAKIRKDIQDKIEKSGRKKRDEQAKNTRVTGSMRADRKTAKALPVSELVKNLSEEFEFNDNQKAAVEKATGTIADVFFTGEIYDMPIRPEIDGMRKELLDSIRISTAEGGLPIIIAQPHPMINPLLARQRDWADVELPSVKAVEEAWNKVAESRRATRGDESTYDVEIDDEGIWIYQDYLHGLIRGFMEDGKDLPIPEKLKITSFNNSTYTSWIEEYVMSLMNIQKGQSLLEGSDGLHDLFGHYGTGRAYDRHGEWANYLAHKDMIEYAPIEWTAAQKEAAHRFWWREYGWLQLDKSPAIREASESWEKNPRWHPDNFDKQFSDLMRWGFNSYPGPVLSLIHI